MSQLQTNLENLQEILNKINNLPEEVVLPKLSNPADASKVLEGYEIINKDGEKVTGIFNANTAVLNFTVVGGTTVPVNPKENTIWVNTNNKITSWIFNTITPTNPSNGMVWISTGTSSHIMFNALNVNGLQVHPLSTRQYVNGEWKSKTAKIYQNGSWVDWHKYIYKNGDFTDITGGWTATKWNGGSELTLTMTVDETGVMTFKSATTGGTGRMGYFYTNNAVNLTDYNKICWNITADNAPSGTSYNHQLFVFTDNNYTTKDAYVYITNDTIGVYEIDISGLTGAYKIGACMTNHTGSTHSISFDSIWLE